MKIIYALYDDTHGGSNPINFYENEDDARDAIQRFRMLADRFEHDVAYHIFPFVLIEKGEHL